MILHLITHLLENALEGKMMSADGKTVDNNLFMQASRSGTYQISNDPAMLQQSIVDAYGMTHVAVDPGTGMTPLAPPTMH